MKRLKIIGIICGLMLTLTLTAFAASSIKIVINGKEAVSSVQPTMQNGSIMVPLRFVSEQLGMDAKWDGSSKTAFISEKTNNVYGSIVIADVISEEDSEADDDTEDDNINLLGIDFKTFDVDSYYDINVCCILENLSAGKHNVKIVTKDPTNEEIQSKSYPLDVTTYGNFVWDTFNVGFSEAGLYWMELYVDGQFINKTAMYCEDF